MKIIPMAIVLAGMAGGAYAADLSDLQTFKVSYVTVVDIKGVQTLQIPGRARFWKNISYTF